MIRRARPADLSAIDRIAKEAYAVYVPRLGRQPAPMIADFKRHIDEDWVIVFEWGGVIAGYAILLSDERRPLLDNIAVAPGHQHSGIGHALIERVEQQADVLGHRSLELYTNVIMTENIRWYEKIGFIEDRRVVEDGFHRVYMKKALGPRP